MNSNPLVQSLTLTLTVGAAIKVSTPEQRERIKDELLPMIKGAAWVKQGTDAHIYTHLTEIMGDWVMPDDYAEQIAALTKKQPPPMFPDTEKRTP